MRGFFRLLGALMLFGLAFRFLSWFIKGLFGRYFILFWGWLICAIIYHWAYHNPDIRFNNNMPQFDPNAKSGCEIFEERVKNGDY